MSTQKNKEKVAMERTNNIEAGQNAEHARQEHPLYLYASPNSLS
eukprot:CAMPEP_0202417412 /NCGR_PEP_ID=MMETSP1128-20130828/42942_1 /ASSEMBLY_ACC=CAM_ASM_000463 /TAXON_ID=3047 /ORGANISM="Dunaliella tertiolecta, Strain CCMP1320" /LENGTH=43 /DNA_ID= /DNA_START= /DNA_END= /DNA_ORIENTATION=